MVGYYPENAEDLLPSFWPLICLNDIRNGMPVAVMDGRAISHVRTAAITAVAAKRRAGVNSRCIGFIACGNQAKAHLEILRSLFEIDLVRAYSRRLHTAEQFCEMAEQAGCRAIATADPKQAIADADIIVTSAPTRATPEFLDAAWLKPGAFVSMVDLGWSWKRESLSALDFVLTDDVEQGGGAAGFNFDGQIAVDIPSILAKPPALPPHARSALIFSGSGLADVAVAELVLRKAQEMALGKSLAL
jgi:ornithine cyclodeaminase/alanine dehydrogenase